jgi:preprotein translocase subunit SecE
MRVMRVFVKNHQGFTTTPKGSGAIGSASVSKTDGWGFESLLPCVERVFPHHTSEGMSKVSESAVTDSGERDPRHEEREGLNIFGRIALFVRQVISELRRVVTPTREELINYIWVVLGFVGVMMTLTFLLDLGFGSLTRWVFGD